MAGKRQYPTPKRIRATRKTFAAKTISKSYKNLLKPYNLKVPK